ncbi:uncharacterized protein LOC144666506 [Oculina patagonica]
MADHSTKVANTARILAIADIIVGFLLVCFGIADRVVGYFWPGIICFGIWIGVWMCITGGLGIPGSRKERCIYHNTYAGIFRGFSIISAVFGGVIIIYYSMSIAGYRDVYRYRYGHTSEIITLYDTEMAISVIILILGIVAFAIGTWAAVCICRVQNRCTCCYNSTPSQQGQVMNTANADNVITQCHGGVPVAIPMKATRGMIAKLHWAHGGQPRLDMVPATLAGNTEPTSASCCAFIIRTGTVQDAIKRKDSSEDLRCPYEFGGSLVNTINKRWTPQKKKNIIN